MPRLPTILKLLQIITFANSVKFYGLHFLVAYISVYYLVSRQFKVDDLKSNLVKCRSYIHVVFNFLNLSTLNFLLFEFATLNCRRTK